MGEFFNDQQRQSYIDALNAELAGYEAKAEAAKAPTGNKDDQAQFTARAKEVRAEIKRVTGTEPDAPADKPKAA
jgi:hypothetical protein